MPLDESILGSSVPFDPSEAADNMVNRQLGDALGTPVDTDMAIDRTVRKLLRPRAAEVTPPTSKASSPTSDTDLPDLSDQGVAVDSLPDLSDQGTPYDPTKPVELPKVGPPKSEHNAFMRGMVTTLAKENPESLGEALEGFSHLAPKDFKGALAQGGVDMKALSDNKIAKEYAKTGKSMWDIEGIDDALTWAGEGLGSMIGSTAPSLVSGVGGALIGGRVAGKVGAMVGGTAGAFGSSYIQNYGQLYKAIKDEKVDPAKAAEYAAWGTVPMAALDVASIGPIISRLGGIKEVEKQLARAIARRVAAEAAKGAGREGITEAVQDVVQSATVSLASDKPFWTEETAKSAAENLALGALGGGAIGAVSGIKSDKVATGPGTGSAGWQTGNGGPSNPGSGPSAGPTPGSGPTGGPQSSPEDINEFVRQANAANPNQSADEQAAPGYTGPDPATMTEAERINAYAAARESHGGARDTDILKSTGLSDEAIAAMDEQDRIDAVIRATKAAEQPAAEAAAEPAKPSPEDEEYALLRAGGYTDENIADMSAQQRAYEAKYYREDLGLNVEDALKRYPRQTAQQQATGQAAPETATSDGTRAAPVKALTAGDVARASEQVAQPTTAQAEAENYRHGHLDLDTLGLTGRSNVSVETGAGGVRRGKGADGTAWEVTMPKDVAYGRIKGTKGADGQPLDIFIGPHPTSPHVFIINQNHPGGQGFDEHKVMAGFINPRAALDAYKASYTDQGGDRIGSVTALSADEFKAWLKSGDTTKPFQKNEPVSSTHDEDTGSAVRPLTEAAGESAAVPKEVSQGGALPETTSGIDNAQDGQPVPDTQTGDGEVLPPAPVATAEVTQDHHDQIEAVLGKDYDHVLPSDVARAAEILADHDGMAPDLAFEHAVIENAVTQGYLTHQEAIDAYGTEVKNVLESEQQAASERGGDTEQAGAGPDQKPAGDAKENEVVSGGRETGTATRGEGQEQQQPDTERQPAEQSDTGGQADGVDDATWWDGLQGWERNDLRHRADLPLKFKAESTPWDKVTPPVRKKILAVRPAFDEAKAKRDAELAKQKADRDAAAREADAIVQRKDGETDKDYFDRLIDAYDEAPRPLENELFQKLRDALTPLTSLEEIKLPIPIKGMTAEIEVRKTPIGYTTGLDADAPNNGVGSGADVFPDLIGKERGYHDDRNTAVRFAAGRAVKWFTSLSKQMDSVATENFRANAVKAAEAVQKWIDDNTTPPSDKAKIEDAGEKIGGARKDEWVGRGLDEGDLDGMTGAELDQFVTKHNVWQKPDYAQAVEDGVNPQAAALIKRIYDSISVKPNPGRYGKIAEVRPLYIKALKAVRDAAREVREVKDVQRLADKVSAKLGRDSFEAVNSLYKPKTRMSPLYVSGRDIRWAEKAVAEGFPNAEPWTRLFMVRESTAMPSAAARTIFDQYAKEASKLFEQNNIALDIEYGGYATRLKLREWKGTAPVDPADLSADLKEVWDKLVEFRDKASPVKKWYVYRKNGGLVGDGHPTKEEAVAAAKAAYDKVGEDRKSGGEEPSRPHLDKIERSGPDYRTGRDVGSEDFITDFGFRGVEFGNWVAGDERQKVVNLAYDALHDLARVLNLPPKAISLDGTLGVGFGSRGRGGRAAAHYEPGRRVINMTKLSGAGSLAHEWAHALDHYLGEAATRNPYAGEPKSISGWDKTPGNPRTAWSASQFEAENYIQPRKLRVAANRLMHTLFNVEESDHDFEERTQKAIEAAKSGQKGWMDYVTRIKEKMKQGGSRAGLQKAETQVEVWGREIARLEKARDAGQRKSRASQFVTEATKLSGSTGDYWRRPNEMFARSFEAYVFDKIATDGFGSQYLVQGVEPDRYGAGFKGNPYPVGDERTAINAAYDRLFRAIETTAGKLGDGTKIKGSEGQPEPIEEVTRVPRPQAQDSAKAEAEAVSKPLTLAGAFEKHFSHGGDFKTIVEARKFAKEAGFTDDPKAIEEAIEEAIVQVARGLATSDHAPSAVYYALTKIYERQPRLGTRTSTSVRDQAYSTPVPLAYLASQLAGITPGTPVFEPTAGNGALLMAANPKISLANEINPTRRDALRAQGFPTTDKDASDKDAFAKVPRKEVVIANPPFGAVREGGESKVFDLSDIQPGYTTHEIDHAIALRALAVMSDNGTAVLILGGVNKLAATPEARSDAYNGKAKREFYKVLYDNYHVTDHFTVSGDLYEKQGAGWPVDVIVIEGRGKSARALPAADVPRIYNSWDRLGGVLDGIRRPEASHARPADDTAGQSADDRAGLEGSGRGRGRGAGRDQSRSGESTGVRGQRTGGDHASPGAAGDQERGGPRGHQQSARSGEQPAAERSSSGLSDDFEDIFNDALDAAYGANESPTPQGTERSDERGQPIIETGVVLRTQSGRETSPAPKIDATTDRKTNATMFRLDSWLLDEARKEVAGNDYQTTLLKGLDPKNFSQSDRDTVNLLLFGDAEGPRPSDIVRIEGPKKKARDTRSTEDVAASAARNAADAADAAFSGLYQLFGGPKVSSGFTFDEETYKKAKPLFEQAAQKFKDFLGDTRELVKRMVAHMRDTLKWPREVMERMGPYLKRFIQDLNAAPAEEVAAQPKEQPKAKKAEKAAVETENQVTYVPQSKAGGLNTLVPVNMRRSIADALADLEDRVGAIDTFVASELAYKDEADLAEYFGAEQIDALGLAIDNLNRGKGFIIGDQTGIGKGRVNAAIIRWAIKKGRIPVFVTEKPGLYADMYRDMRDIGMFDGGFLDGQPRILATNAALKLPLDEEGTEKIATSDAKAHNKVMADNATADAAEFGKNYDMVFTNYSQMQTVKGEDTARRQFLKAIIRNAVMIFDESHNAGGQANTRKAKDAAVDRATFARELVQSSKGVFYSSATYAKRPDVMDLYAATDMAMAVDDLDQLAEAIQRGGVPMQQVVATMLAEAGQYIRRERSFDGINYNTPVVTVSRSNYDKISSALAAIQSLSKSVEDAAKRVSQQLKAEGAAMGADGATGDAGASSTSFTAIMHNVINQLLLAMKAEPAAQRAIEAIRRGEKPVLTVANTMESFLSDYADNVGVSPGEVMDADFGDVLLKYLDRTRTIIIRKPFAKKGETIRHYLTDAELGSHGLSIYNAAKAKIVGMDLSGLPVSPIDHLKGRLQQEGYRVGEITGRSLIVDYTGDAPVLRTRPTSETSTRGRNAARAGFNKKPSKGGLHAIIINQAGSTGISMHASATFDDQSKRRMIIVQPEGNIDTHMQLLGRVNRTGQVVLPEYDQLVADIPAERRPAAVLAKKMASLNANTTASRSSALTSKEVPDFINEYGDQIAVGYLADNLEMNPRLAFPVKVNDSGKFDAKDAMRKLTGRIPLLPLKEQEEVYEHLESEYHALIEQLEASGENALEAKTVDLKAKVLERATVQGERNGSGSPFAAPVVVEKVSIVRPGKPYKPLDLINLLRDKVDTSGTKLTDDNLDKLADELRAVSEPSDYRSTHAKAFARLAVQERRDMLKVFDDYTRPILDDIADPEKKAKEIAKFNAIKDRWESVHKLAQIGARVVLKSMAGNIPAIVIDVHRTGDAKNPLALGTWKATFAIPDATKTMTLSFNRMVENGKADPESILDVEVEPMTPWYETYKQTLERFAFKQTEAREERYIATGNLLSAYEWLNNRGAIMNYTDANGVIRQGILTARDFDLSKHAIARGRLMITPQEIKQHVDANEDAASEGEIVIVAKESRWSDNYVISAQKKKSTGGVFYLDKELTALTGDFYSRAGRMETTVPANKIIPAIERMQKLGAKFKAPAMAPKAEKVEDDTLASVAPADVSLTAEALNRRADIEQTVKDIVYHLVGANNVGVHLTDDLFGQDRQVQGWGDVSKRFAGLRGQYSISRHLITLAMIKGAELTAVHEAYHAIEFQLQTNRERDLMARETPRIRAWLKANKDALHNHKMSDSDIDSLAGYEVRAIGFETFMADKATKTGLHGGVRRWYQRLKDAVIRLANFLRGLGFNTFSDIYESAARGEFAQRESRTGEESAQLDLLASLAGGGSGGRRPPGGRPGGPNSFDDSIGDIVGKRIATVIPDIIARRNMTEVRVKLQDKFIRVLKAEDSVGNVDAALSAYQAESLYYGRTGQRLEELEDQKFDPVIRELQGRDIDLDDFNDYLYAKHAQERNEYVGRMHKPGTQFNDAVFDTSIVGASGVSTDEANQYLADVAASGKLIEYQMIEAMVRDIQKRTLSAMLAYGLISQEVYDSLKNTYRYYVPLRGFAEGSEHEESLRSGKGYDTRGKEFKMAFGRRSKAAGPLQHIFMQAEMAIVRGEKNRVGNVFLRFVQNNPDPDRWEVNRPKIAPRVDSRTGMISYMPDNFSDYSDPNTFITKVGGKPYRIVLKGPDGENLARALKTMGTAQVNTVVHAIGAITRMMARLATAWNPNFVVRNFMRDVGEAFINLGEQDQAEIVKKFRQHLPKAIVGAYRAIADKSGRPSQDRYVTAFREFDAAGGRVHFFGLEDADDFERNVRKKMRRLEGGIINKTLDGAEVIGDALEVVNGSIENATRLAAFMAAKDVGMSSAEAARLARELTINFNRKGEWGSAINAMYMFGNVGFQGIVRMMQALRYSKVRRNVAILAAIGAATTLYSMLVGGDDDDKENLYMQLPSWERDRSLIILWPKALRGDMQGYGLKIPLPFGYAPFAVAGSHLVSMLLGKETPAAAAMAIGASLFDAFDPIGRDQNWIAAIAPTLLRPAIHIGTNKNWTGKPLYPDSVFAKGVPDSHQSFRTNSVFSKELAAKLNEWTGGSTYKPGLVDVHPGSIDHWIQTVTGGLGQFVKQVIQTPWDAYNGEWQVNKTPILGGFLTKAGGDAAKNSAYYDARQSVKERADEITRARSDLKRGINVEESRKFIEQNNNAAEAHIFKAADAQLSKLRARQRQIDADTSMPADEKKAQSEDIRKRMREIQMSARTRYRELKGQNP